MCCKIKKCSNIIALLMVCFLLNFHFQWGYLCFLGLGVFLFILSITIMEKKICPLCSIYDLRGQFVFLMLYLIVAFLTKDIFNIGNVIDYIYISLPLPLLLILNQKCNIKYGLFYGLCLSIFVGSLYSYYVYFIEGLYRPSGFMYNPIAWVSFLVLSLPLIMYKIYLEKNSSSNEKNILCILGAFIFIDLYIAHTRAIFIALLICAPILLMVYKFSWKYVLFFICSLILCWFGRDFIIAKVSRGYDIDRWHGYWASWDMFIKHPLLGVGPAYWKDVYQSIYWVQHGGELLPHAHNIYLSFLAKSGIIGFVGLIYCLGYYLWRFYKKIKHKDIYAWCGIAGLLVFMLHGLFDSLLDVRSSTRVFWLFMALYNINMFEGNGSEDK